MALHRRDNGLRQVRELVDHLRMIVKLGTSLDILSDFHKIITGREVSARTAYDYKADRLGFAGDCINMLFQRLEDVFGERIELFGPIERENGGLVLIFP